MILFRLIDKLLRIPPTKLEPVVYPIKPDPPPWDVPLDQTTSIGHIEGGELPR